MVQASLMFVVDGVTTTCLNAMAGSSPPAVPPYAATARVDTGRRVIYGDVPRSGARAAVDVDGRFGTVVEEWPAL